MRVSRCRALQHQDDPLLLVYLVLRMSARRWRLGPGSRPGPAPTGWSNTTGERHWMLWSRASSKAPAHQAAPHVRAVAAPRSECSNASTTSRAAAPPHLLLVHLALQLPKPRPQVVVADHVLGAAAAKRGWAGWGGRQAVCQRACANWLVRVGRWGTSSPQRPSLQLHGHNKFLKYLAAAAPCAWRHCCFPHNTVGRQAHSSWSCWG